MDRVEGQSNELAESRAIFEQKKREIGALALLGVGSLLVISYLLLSVLPYPWLERRYAILPNPYLAWFALLVVVGFVYANLFLIKHRLRGGRLKFAAIFLSVLALSLVAASLVREAGYRAPGLRISGADRDAHRMGIATYLEAKKTDPWCVRNDEECIRKIKFYFEDKVAAELIEKHKVLFLIVEGMAIAAMVAAVALLHRLIMSGRLQRSRYGLIRSIHQYAAES